MKRSAFLAALIVAGLSCGARAADVSADAGCHPLLVDTECRDYHAHLNNAATPEQRATLQRRYDRLVRERLRSCPCKSQYQSSEESPASARRLPGGGEWLLI